MDRYTKPQDVRSESLTFQIAVITALMNIQKLIPNVMLKRRHTEWFELEAAVIGLHAMLAPYYDSNYKAKVTEFKEKLGKVRDEYKQVEYMWILADWIEEIIKRFGQVDILPPARITIEPRGPDDEDS